MFIGPASQPLAHSWQSSSFSNFDDTDFSFDGIAGTASILVSRAPERPSATSWTSVSFELGGPHLLSVSGQLSLTGKDPNVHAGWPSFPFLTFRLASQDPCDGCISVGRSLDDDGEVSFHFDRILEPGEYDLNVQAMMDYILADGTATANYDFELSLTPIPEPATGMLVVLGGVFALLVCRYRLCGA